MLNIGNIFTNGTKNLLRIIIPVTLTVILFIIAQFLIFIPAIENDLIEQKRLMISELVYSVHNVVEYFHDLELHGKISRSEAKIQALEQVRKIRYGPENKDYFWINDLHPNMVMHPYTPHLENTSLADYQDPKGKRLFVECVTTVEEKGEGYVDYIWQWKDNSEILVPKLSFVKGFEPWDWIIGTGIYLDDVQKEIDDIVKGQNFAALVIVMFISFLSFSIVRQNLGLEKKRKAANELLSTSETKYKTIFENTGSALALIENDMSISLVNTEFETLSGYSKKKVENIMTFSEFFDNEYVGRMIDYHSSRREKPGNTPEKYESVFIDIEQNRKNVWLTVEMIPDTDMSILSILDITLQKKSEEALQYRLGIEELLTNISTYFITLTDKELDNGINYALNYIGEFTNVDRSYLFQYKEDGQKIENTHEWCAQGVDPQIDRLKDIPTESIIWWMNNLKNFEIIYAPDVGLLPAEAEVEKNILKEQGIKSVLAVPLLYGKELLGFMGFDSVTDLKYWTNEDIDLLQAISDIIANSIQQKKSIEEKQKLETQLYQAQKMESIGRLAGGIAHDFNNILTSTMGYAEILKMKFDDQSTIEGQAVDVILRSSQKAGDLTKQLLSFSRDDVFNPVSLNANKLLKDCVRVSENIFEKTIEMHYSLVEDLHKVTADRNQLDQVFTNLLINAKDAMPDKGKISLSTENVTVDDQSSEMHIEMKSGDYVKISVEDSGIGIPLEIKDKIFEPFFTTKGVGKGTGLGLSMVYGIIKKHNGFINVESEPGRGTSFHIYLPVSTRNITQANEDSTLYKGNSTILVVDDEINQRSLSQSLLARLGYEIITASNGKEGSDIYREKHDQIDLVILDVIMPDMPGKETFLEMKITNPDVKVIVVSGYSQNGKVEEILKEGAIAFLQKPYRLHEISKVIRKTLTS
ncbi:MAG: response regulator [bacterium]|nr:response regulator [bacterium]